MLKIRTPLIALACTLLALTACGGPKTPQEVTEAFWTAVRDNDADDIVEYSTLRDINGYDRFSRDDWAEAKLSWSKVVIDGSDAEIGTEVLHPGESEEAKLTFTTYLVRQGEQWMVDYDRTSDGLRAGTMLHDIVQQVDAIGREISNRFDEASRGLDENLKDMAEEFRELSQSIQKSTSESVERYGNKLREHMDELADSIDRALKEHSDEVSDEDGRVLREVSDDLHDGSENSDSVAESGNTLATALQRLDEVDGEVFARYKERWAAWRDDLETEMRSVLDKRTGEGI